MRRFLATSFFALSLVISATGAAPAAHAAATTTATAFTSQDATDAYQSCIANKNNTLDECRAAYAAYTSLIGTPTTAPPSNLPTDLAGADADKFGAVMTWIMTLFAWLVGVAALTLDYAVYYTVVTMGDYVHRLAAVGLTWRILRDVANIMLIFGFLGAGIATILNVDKYGWKTKMIPMLLVAAVFLNFSLFVSESMIDVTNLFATQFYTQINGGSLPQATSNGLTVNGTAITTANEGISNAIMGTLGLQTIYNGGKVNTDVYKGGNTWLIGFMGIILFIITAFVMFSLAFILIARFVALIFFIILSPVGFMGLAIPQMESRASQWWKNFLEQIITAPVLLLLLYVALAVITDARFLTGLCTPTTPGGACAQDAWLGFMNGNYTSFAGVLLSFFVAMGLLLVVVIKAKDMSAFGSDLATKTAGKLTFGATAFGLRSTAGLGSQLASQAIRRSRFNGTKTGRLLATTFDRGAKASFDVRGISAVKKVLDFDAGKQQEGGYRARQEKSVKGHEEYIKSVEKAVEEGNINKVIAAQSARAVADKEKSTAQAEHSALDTEVKKQKEEIARLEKIVNEHRNNGTMLSPAAITAGKALEDARTKVAPDIKKLATAAEKLEQATKNSTDTEKAEKEANKDVSDKKKSAKVAYAGNIQGKFFGNSVPGWIAFGPGGSSAAKQMIKDATKKETDAQKALKTLEAVIKGNAKDDKPDKKAETPAPAAGGH